MKGFLAKLLLVHVTDMRERDEIPEWALDAVRRHLRHGEEIINATALKVGTKHAVLLNTSKGAALAVKGMLTSPDSVVLGFPQDLLTYRCHACAARNVVIDMHPPDDVHCTQCGQAQHLVRAGEVRALGGTEAQPKRATKPRAKRPSTTKTATKRTKQKATRARKGSGRPSATRATPKGVGSKSTSSYRPQCLALTPDDAQCRNSARAGSKYCGVHKSYRPPAAARARSAKDTLPRVRGAKDTAPSGRKKNRTRSTTKRAPARKR